MLRGDRGLEGCARYWESRHRDRRGDFRAVADPGLTDAANAEQYAVKRSRLEGAIRSNFRDCDGLTLLEAGCGIGLLTPFYAGLGFSVTAVDFSRTALCEARRRFGDAQYVRCRLSEMELGRSFHAIVVVDVLLHVVNEAEWSATWGALARHLEMGGVLFVLETIDEGGEDWPEHCKPRLMEAYEEAVGEAGLCIDRVETFRLEGEGATKHLLAVSAR